MRPIGRAAVDCIRPIVVDRNVEYLTELTGRLHCFHRLRQTFGPAIEVAVGDAVSARNTDPLKTASVTDHGSRSQNSGFESADALLVGQHRRGNVLSVHNESARQHDVAVDGDTAGIVGIDVDG